MTGPKYELIPDKSEPEFFRIRALRDFGNVTAGEKGGLISSEHNLSQYGEAWISRGARVIESAHVYGDAQIVDRATVSGDARVMGRARVGGQASVSEYARVHGEATVRGRSQVKGTATVNGSATIDGDAIVMGDCVVEGLAYIADGAVVAESHLVGGRKIVKTDLRLHDRAAIAAQLDVAPVNGAYTLFKRVNRTDDPLVFASEWDSHFHYIVGERAVAIDPDEDKTASCSRGLHVSTATYWDGQCDTLIAVSVAEEDIICCQEGKLRVRALTVLEEVTL